MLFPELRRAVKRLIAPDSGELLSLNLKQANLPGFSPSDVASLQWYVANGYYGIASALAGGFPSWSGEVVSRQAALQHSAVWACNKIVSESLGFIPCKLMRRTSAGKVEATDHPLYSLLLNAPNAEQTAQEFTERGTSHVLLSGMAYAKITRRSGTGVAIEFEQLLPEQVTPDREKTGQKRLVYVVGKGGPDEKTYTLDPSKPQDILCIRGLGWDGLRGYDVITMGRQSIGSGIAAERNVARFWANGGRKPYHLEHPSHFKDDQEFNDYRENWQTVYSQPHLAPILEDGMKYVPDGMTMVEAQSLETRQFNIAEACRWFGVAPHLIFELSRSTNNNIEQQALDFVKLTLSPWLTRWEQALWRCALTPEEKAQGYYFKHNVNAMLRGDFKTRFEGYASALQNGIYSVDEVRDLEDWNPLPNGAGADHYIQLNMQPLPEGAPSPAPRQIVRLTGQGGPNGRTSSTGN